MDPFAWRTAQELESKFLARMDELAGDDIRELTLAIEDDRVVIAGEVYSDDVRSLAIRVLAAFLTDRRIEERIEVLGVFHPATNDEWFLHSGTDPEPGGEHTSGVDSSFAASAAKAVERYSSLAHEGELVPGRTIVVIADLPDQAPSPAATRIRLDTLPPGWGSLDVDVTISSTALEAGGRPGRIIVYENGTSQAARIEATVRSDLPAGTPVEITAVFTIEGRFCGTDAVSFGSVLPSPASGSTPQAVLLAREAGPAMTVTIVSLNELELQWHLAFGIGVERPNVAGVAVTQLTTAPSTYAAQLMQKCPEMAPQDVARQMGSIGETLWNAAPLEFKTSYQHIRSAMGRGFPIQFMLSDLHIPWEMMRPPEGEHLFLTHPVARWITNRSDFPPRLPSGEKVSFVPNYDNNGTLPAAKEEQRRLIETLGAKAADPTKSGFLDLMACEAGTEQIALVHFAGHGRASRDSEDAVLRMRDGDVTILDVNVSDTRLGERDRCLMVLNACEAASVSHSLSWVEGWAPTMLMRGFGGLVAPLWRVQDGAACEVVTSGLTAFYRDGATLGAAFTVARAKLARKSAAAYAFVTYGDVMAKAET